ncbi:helix-turn-helix transcriptional regulator [Gordonia zhaorongruii]|uniref:helix-turn-helix transcriptional regulator n=1 Tax=Gordonia zhaorongruii TaxID=2597659 RepID=UPI00104F775F|nr:helix-turn-helix domain-containing protein [Gordonia zhaorongruii]
MSLRATVLQALRDAASPVTVADLATRLGTPQTTVRFHLKSLSDDGLVEARPESGSGRGRPQMRYRSRQAMDPAGPRDYGFLAQALVDALGDTPDGQQRAMTAGRELGRGRARPDVEAASDVVDVLDDMGFAPSVDGAAIRLDRCPFLEAARRRPGVTCSVHRGLMQGVLDAHRDGRTVTRLDAFVDGDHCLAQLSGSSQ